ncbi:hypothetical protein, partial [Klebsiella pneumoniae]
TCPYTNRRQADHQMSPPHHSSSPTTASNARTSPSPPGDGRGGSAMASRTTPLSAAHQHCRRRPAGRGRGAMSTGNAERSSIIRA